MFWANVHSRLEFDSSGRFGVQVRYSVPEGGSVFSTLEKRGTQNLVPEFTALSDQIRDLSVHEWRTD